MDWRNLDERLSQHHDGESYPIDTDALWGAVQPHIPSKEPGNRIPIFLLIPGLILLLGGAYFLGYTNAKQAQDVDIAQVDQLSTVQQTVLHEDDESGYSTGELQQDVSERDEPIATSAGVPRRANTVTQFQYDQSLPNLAKTEISGNNHITLHNGASGSNWSRIGLANNSSLFSVSPTVFDFTKRSDLVKNTEHSTIETFGLAKLQRAIEPLHIGLDALPEKPEADRLKSYYSSLHNKDSRYYVELTGGLSRITSQLSLATPNTLSNAAAMNNIAATANELTRRRIAESNLISFTGDLKFGYKFTDNISVQTGLTFAQLVKSSDSVLEFTRDVVVDDVLLEEIITVDGVMQVFGTAILSESVSQRRTRINRFNQLLLPLSVLYRNDLDKIYFDLEFGGAISLVQDYNGFINRSDIEEYSISDDTQGLYRDGRNSYLIFGAGIGIPFNERIELVSRLNYYQQLNAISSADYGINENLSFLRLQFGLRHNF